MNPNFAKECFEKTVNTIQQKSSVLFEKCILKINETSNIGFFYCKYSSRMDLYNSNIIEATVKLLENSGFKVLTDKIELSIYCDKNSTGMAAEIYQKVMKKINDDNALVFHDILDQIHKESQINGNFYLHYEFNSYCCANPESVRKMIFDSGFDINEVDDNFDNYFKIDWTNPR